VTTKRTPPDPESTNGLALELFDRVRAATVPAKAAPLECSVGIMAYNEEGNIADAITAILGQPLRGARIAELIVVASGCTDRTCEIVAEIARSEPRVHVIEQERREGKASAVNLFTARASSPVLLMVSADVIVEKGTIDALLRHFADPEVGMVGGHPVPVNDENSFLGHAVHLLWRLHDRLAREAPKLGEIVAFRNVVPSIPGDTAVDEISIQALVTQLGYRLVYEPDALVFNRGPATIAEFLSQRRRIYAGHVLVRRQQGYTASTMSVRRILRVLVRAGAFSGFRATCWTLGAIALEALARMLGTWDTLRGRSHSVWDAVATTKREIVDGVNAEGLQNVLVFHIANFNLHQLELGKRAARQLTEQVAHEVGSVFGFRTVVTDQRSGTVIALMPGDRNEAERAARSLVTGLSQPELACGIITFSQETQPLAKSFSQAHADVGLAALVTSQET
jgi:glycosyltransferase involved in cell wall biosynthesis